MIMASEITVAVFKIIANAMTAAKVLTAAVPVDEVMAVAMVTKSGRLL